MSNGSLQFEDHEVPSLYLAAGAVRFDLGSAEGLRRLREAVGKLFQVNQLCVLVGSGASIHLGSPTIRSMTAMDVVEMCRAANGHLDEAQERLLEGLASSSADLERIVSQLAAAVAFMEAFNCSTVELARRQWGRAAIEELFSAVNAGLAHVCDLPKPGIALSHPHDTDPWYSHREFFRRLLGARRPDSARVKVFTTNYDTVIERTLDDCGIRYFDGFVGGVRRTLSLSTYETDLFTLPATGRSSLLRVPDVVQFFKLHGSLNWRIEPSPSGLGTQRVVQVEGSPDAGQLAVIYPTPAKEVDVVGYPYADLLRSFGSAISTPECALVVIGYGFADDHINRLVFQAMAQNTSLQLLVVDPYGVVEDGPVEVGKELPRRETPVGRLSLVPDARISIVTGEIARFTSFALALPDAADRSAEQQQELEGQLSSAFFPNQNPAGEPEVDK